MVGIRNKLKLAARKKSRCDCKDRRTAKFIRFTLLAYLKIPQQPPQERAVAELKRLEGIKKIENERFRALARELKRLESSGFSDLKSKIKLASQKKL